MRACENVGRTSAPFLPQGVQVKFGSMSESRISSAHGSESDVSARQLAGRFTRRSGRQAMIAAMEAAFPLQAFSRAAG
jgi:hypothetical protein